MTVRMSDWKRASVAAAALTGLAVAVVFGIKPGGFEGQVGWFFALLPVSLVAYPLSDYVYKVAPPAGPIVLWALIFGLNFLWYWGISYAVIKIRRFLGAP